MSLPDDEKAPPPPAPARESELAAFIRCEAPKIIAETRRRETGDFDGLLGGLPDGAATALNALLTLNRDYLMRVYSSGPKGEQTIRTLIREHNAQPERFTAVTPVVAGLAPGDDTSEAPDTVTRYDGIRLAIAAMGTFVDALAPGQTSDEYMWRLISGSAGAAGAKVKADGRKGGRIRAAEREGEAATAHAKWIKYANGILETRAASRSSLSTRTAKHFKVTPQAVRPVLQAAGLVPKRRPQEKGK